MTTSLALNTYLLANITLKSLSDYSTQTLNLVNRIPLTEFNDTPIFFPILESVSEAGSVSDNVSVLPQAGSITLINSIGSFGVERKFSDLLERHTIHNQPIAVYYTSQASEDEGLVTFSETAFNGFINSWEVSGDRIIINFDNRRFPKKNLNRTISVAEAINASAAFTPLPVVFGVNVEVRPIRLTADGAAPTYAYATTLGTTYPVGGVSKYYCKNVSGQYSEVASAGTTSTVVFGHAYQSAKNHAGYGGLTARAVPFSSSTGYILTGAGMRVYKSAGTDTEFINVEIRADDQAQGSAPTNAPGTVLAKGTYNLSSLASGAGEYDLFFPLSSSVVIVPNKTYYFVSTYSNVLATGKLESYYDSAVSETAYQQPYQSTSPGGPWTAATPASSYDKKWYWQLYGVVLTDTAAGSVDSATGLGMASFAATQWIDSTADLSKLDMIVAVNGLKDDSSGTITGSSSQQIRYLHEAAELLSQEWDGAAWNLSSYWDFDQFAEGKALSLAGERFERIIKGATNGLTSFEEWIRAACLDLGAKVAMNQDGLLGVYYWGGTLASEKTFTQENCRITDIRALDPSYVVNSLEFAYGKVLITLDTIRALTDKVATNYSGIAAASYATDTEFANYLTRSVALFGDKVLASQLINWFGNSTTATTMLRFLALNYAMPPVYLTLECPLIDNLTLDIQKVVTIKHPMLSCYYGSSANTKQPHYNGEPVDILNGFNLTRASRVRAQIEEAYRDLSGPIPIMRLVCRLLLNPNDPT